MRPALCFGLILTFVAADLLAQDPPDYTHAARLVQEQQWAGALDEIQKLQEKYPDNPKVWNLEGLALTGQGDYRKAEVAFQHVLAAHPSFFPALKNLAIVEWQIKSPGAVNHTVQALAIEPRDPVLNAYAAVVDLRRKDPGAANQRLNLAGGAISAMDLRTEAELAYLLGTRGLYTNSARVYRDLAARGGYDSTVTYDLALAEYLAGNYQNVIEILEQAESQRHSQDALNLLAQAYEKNRQTQPAIDRLREAIDLFPKDENNYLDLATICIDHNSYPLGIEIVQLGLKNKPSSERLLFQLGILHALSGEFDKARDEFRRAKKLVPGKDLPVAALELADLQQNGPKDNLQALRHSLRQNDDSAILWYLLGSSLMHNGSSPGTSDYREARAAFRKAIRLDPKLPYPYIELGKMYEQEERILDAIPLFEKAAVLGPRDPSSYYHLARDYKKLNQPQKAAQMLNKLKELELRSREFEEVGLTQPAG